MDHTNEMQLIFDSRSSNESFARVTVAAFMTSLNPTVEEVSDVKTAVSEAVTDIRYKENGKLTLMLASHFTQCLEKLQIFLF